MFLPSVCEWIGECDKCWKALRAVSRLQKGAIEMQICYHLVEPCIKSTLEEIIENRGTWPSPDQSTIQYLWQHLKTEKAELSVTSQEASWTVSHHAGEHELAGLSLSCWVRAARVHEGGKTEIFMDIFRKVQLFSWTDRQFNNRKSITFETLFCLIVSEFFILL